MKQQKILKRKINYLRWFVFQGEELLLVTEKGVIVRTNADKISQQSRAATGVKLQRLDDGDHLSEVVLVPREQIEEKDQPSSVEQN